MELPQLNRSSLESPYAQELERGFPMLKFAGPLEKEFRDFYVAQNVLRVRLSALIALVLVVAASVIEAVFVDYAGRDTANLVRLFVLAPSLGCIVLATYLPSLNRFYELILSVAVLAIGVAIIYISHAAALGGSSYQLAGVVLAILYACLFLGLQFYQAVGLTVTLIAAHLVTGAIVGLPLDLLLYTTAIAIAASVIGSISTYYFEYALRTSFLETRLLNELAQRDGLTGIYNRRIFDDYMKRLWRQSRREKKQVEILMIDIDYFKIYNDLYGHQAGDDCLRAVAQTISRAAKRPFDFCARYGGEEFILVLYGPPIDYARSLPEQLRQDVMDLQIEHRGSNVDNIVTVSVGVALADPASGRSLVGAIQAADEALYEAKQVGRNRVVFKDASECEVETGNFRVSLRTMQR
jgi:diguanylate cyclase (GGDEF)-like protein